MTGIQHNNIVSATINERREQGATRQNILQLLRRHGPMTAIELSQELRIGAVGVRQHLALLERDGMVEVAELRRSIGRPSHVYTLTKDSERLFPKSYDKLALDILNCISEECGNDAAQQVLGARRRNLMKTYAPFLEGKDRSEQVAELTRLLADRGYMCEYEQLEDGSFVLTQHNCPILCVAEHHQSLCSQELLLYQDLLGVSIVRDETISKGGICCRYHIPA